jgi:hypothetical protein
MSNIIGYKLNWWENLNKEMDLATKAHWADTHLLNRPSPAMLSTLEGWHVPYHHQKLSRIQVVLIYEAIHTPATEEYWVTHKIICTTAKFDLANTNGW